MQSTWIPVIFFISFGAIILNTVLVCKSDSQALNVMSSYKQGEYAMLLSDKASSEMEAVSICQQWFLTVSRNYINVYPCIVPTELFVFQEECPILSSSFFSCTTFAWITGSVFTTRSLDRCLAKGFGIVCIGIP